MGKWQSLLFCFAVLCVKHDWEPPGKFDIMWLHDQGEGWAQKIFEENKSLNRIERTNTRNWISF